MREMDFVKHYFDAWNQADARSIADHLSPDGTYFDMPDQKEFDHDELVRTLSDSFVHEKNHYQLVGEVLTGKNSISFQYSVSPLDPKLDEESSGPWYGAEFITLQGDSAIRIDDYYEHPGHKQDSRSNVIQQKKYAKSGLTAQQLDVYKGQLSALMRSEKVFLNSELTLPRLAALVECPINHLSQVINSGFRMSFFDYLNQHRIEEAKKRLRVHEGYVQAILSIAFEVGFNSNSAFYAAFKKSCGQTPAQYRQKESGKI